MEVGKLRRLRANNEAARHVTRDLRAADVSVESEIVRW